jgi:Family of unknown function (DUF6326)
VPDEGNSDFFWRLKIVMMDKKNAPLLDDIKIHVRFKLFALWSSVMFFYIYGDYFELYQPGKLQEMIAGRMVFGVVSQAVLLGMAAVMVIPSLMPFLSLVLPTRVNRWMNIVFGVLYSVIMILVIRGGWHFYIFFGLIEITLTVLIVWYAWTWPKHPNP